MHMFITMRYYYSSLDRNNKPRGRSDRDISVYIYPKSSLRKMFCFFPLNYFLFLHVRQIYLNVELGAISRAVIAK